MLAGAIIALIVYLMALLCPWWGGVGGLAWQYAITILAIIAVGAICVIIAWVGYTLLTTPAPTSLETPPSVEAEEKGESEGEGSG